jgi:hypothetical protein
MAFEYTTCKKFGGTDFDTDHYLVVETVRERLAVSKQATQKSDGESLNLRKLNELEVRERYEIEVTGRVADLENLSDSEDINWAWENIKGDMKSSA